MSVEFFEAFADLRDCSIQALVGASYEERRRYGSCEAFGDSCPVTPLPMTATVFKGRMLEPPIPI
ncbi:hypothetical protein [Mesorhizobium sp. M0587]